MIEVWSSFRDPKHSAKWHLVNGKHPAPIHMENLAFVLISQVMPRIFKAVLSQFSIYGPLFDADLLLMEENLHRLGCKK